jgi:hypothetical protein
MMVLRSLALHDIESGLQIHRATPHKRASWLRTRALRRCSHRDERCVQTPSSLCIGRWRAPALVGRCRKLCSLTSPTASWFLRVHWIPRNRTKT